MTRPAAAKLGLKPGRSGWVAGGTLEGFVDGVPEAPPDVIVAFVRCIADVGGRLAEVMPFYRRGAGLWFAYPKRSGAHRSDISRDRGWTAVEAAGLLPVSQVAIDADWSALRFRFRDEIPKLARRPERDRQTAG